MTQWPALDTLPYIIQMINDQMCVVLCCTIGTWKLIMIQFDRLVQNIGLKQYSPEITTIKSLCPEFQSKFSSWRVNKNSCRCKRSTSSHEAAHLTDMRVKKSAVALTQISAYITHKNLAALKIMEAMRTAYAKKRNSVSTRLKQNMTHTITEHTSMWKETAHRLRKTFFFFCWIVWIT